MSAVSRARTGLGLTLVLVAFLLAGCSLLFPVGFLGSGDGARPTPRPTSVIAGPTSSSVPTSRGWKLVSGATSGIVFAVPPDWQQVPIEALRQQLQAMTSGSTGEIHDAYAWFVKVIDDGRMDSVAAGPAGVPDTAASILLVVDTGDADLDTAVQRLVADEADHVPSRKVVEQSAVSLPIGPAVRILATATPSGGLASMNVEYIVRLKDGRTLWMDASTLQTDTAFADWMSEVAATLTQT